MLADPIGGNSTVTGAIRQAARVTGTNFQYLLATAQVESKVNPNAQASTSSARGLFQFIDQTWLATLKEHGAAFGFERYANAIARTPSGQYAVTDQRLQNPIMNLRGDPSANALMAGVFTRVNAGKLTARLGRNPSEGELYIAHFLGPTGASRLINMADAKPELPAASIFRGAARSNPSIFYDRAGRARSVSDVYRVLVGRYDVARGGAKDPAAVVAGQNPPVSFAPPPAPLAETYGAAALFSAPKPNDSGPVFHGLFRTGERREAVAPVVSALWGTPAAAPSAAAVAPVAPAPVAPEGGALDLFQDRAPDARALFRGRV